MSREFVFESPIAPYIVGFIAEKQSLGFKYFNESKWMKKFDDYWIEHGYGKTGLTVENLENWTMKRDCEGAKCLAARVSVIRQFSIYLNSLGVSSYFPPIEARYSRPLVHILTEPEIAEIFAKIDAYAPKTKVAHLKRMGNEYPVLFRLIYLNGLRISEACNLSVSNVDLAKGILTIIDGKGNKDRVIYLADDMKQLCREYFQYLCAELGEAPEWFFPGVSPGKPISTSTVDKKFDDCWGRTSFADHCGRKPTVHGFRHAYVIKRINLWMEQGRVFDHMLPYLCKFLGHKDFRDTYYYYHYVEETARIIQKKDTITNKVIPEVMRR